MTKMTAVISAESSSRIDSRSPTPVKLNPLTAFDHKIHDNDCKTNAEHEHHHERIQTTSFTCLNEVLVLPKIETPVSSIVATVSEHQHLPLIVENCSKNYDVYCILFLCSL